jgi:alpha-ketoglutarate-dependent taurine dioxygenase
MQSPSQCAGDNHMPGLGTRPVMTSSSGLLQSLQADDVTCEAVAAQDARAVPILIESATGGSLEDYLASKQCQVKAALCAAGCVLFRGFHVPDEASFESAMSSLRGISPMDGYFMAEPGRERVAGTKFVFYTNQHLKTGGSIRIGSLHSENYHSVDVPLFQAFWCKRTPWLGGGTALVQMRNAYAELTETVRESIEATSCVAKRWKVSQIAERYGLSVALVDRFFESRGALVADADGNKRIVIRKASVYRHPRMDGQSLMLNLHNLPRLNGMLCDRLAARHTGWQWALHRAAWRRPNVRWLWARFEMLPYAVRHPQVVGKRELKSLVRALAAVLRGQRPGELSQGTRDTSGPGRLDSAWSRAELTQIAKAISRHLSEVRWERHDVLLLDNLQILHGGMPGFGPRQLRVMLFNPVHAPMDVARGVTDVVENRGDGSVHAQLLSLCRSHATSAADL